MRFWEDVIHQLVSCQSAVCWGWHAALAVGALALGIWLARELWGYHREDSETEGAMTEPGVDGQEEAATWLGLPPETATQAVLVEGMPAGLREGEPETEPDPDPDPGVGEPVSGPGPGGHLGDTDDDLTLVRGISLAVAEGLRAEGIRTFAEMAGCPASRWKGVAGHLGVEEAAASGDWMGQARDLAFLSDLARRGAEGSGWTDPGVAARVVQDAEEWGDWVRVDPELGLVFDLRPETTDRLTEIEGVSESVAEALGTIGIWQFRQIARWTDGQVEGIASRLGIPVRQIEAQAWVARAALRHRCIYRASPIWGEARPAAWRYEELLNQYPLRDAVETDETRGVVFLRAPEERDDLTRIEGIEAGLAERLEEAGVFRYRQVADWSEANAEVFAARLGIPLARIYRERWIPQARRMLA